METTYTVQNDKGESWQVDESKLADAEKDGFLPQVSNGTDVARASQADLAQAAKDGYRPVVDRKVSQLESGVRGAAQGATLGFGDEITGAAETAGKTLFGNEKLRDFPANYAQHRDEARNANAVARTSNPFTYGAGEVAGSIPAVAIASRGGVPGLAAMGAAQGAGASEANNVTDIAGDSAKSAALSALLAGVGAGVGKSISKGVETLSRPAVAPVAEAGGSLLDKLTMPAVAGYTADMLVPGSGTMIGSGLAAAKMLPGAINTIRQKAPAVIQSIKDIPAAVISSKFGAVLDAAAKRGAQSLAVTNFILSTTNPEYRELSKKDEETHGTENK